MNFLLKMLTTLLTTYIAPIVLLSLRETVPETIHQINLAVKRQITIALFKLALMILFSAAFLFAFNAAMTQLDYVGHLYFSASLTGPSILALLCILLFFLPSHLMKRKKVTTDTPKKLAPIVKKDELSGMYILLNELKQEQQQFIQSLKE